MDKKEETKTNISKIDSKTYFKIGALVIIFILALYVGYITLVSDTSSDGEKTTQDTLPSAQINDQKKEVSSPTSLEKTKEPIKEEPKQILVHPLSFEKVSFPGEHYYTGVWADFDNDKDLDILGINYDRQSYIYENDKGIFLPHEVFYGYDTKAIAAVDINQDGWNDFILGNYNQPSAFFINNQDGSFTENKAFDTYPVEALVSADFNNDNYPDVIIAAPFKPLKIFVNNQNNAFTEKIILEKKVPFSALTTCDINNDGNMDILVGSDFQENYLLIGNGDGSFSLSPQFGTKQHTKAIACADIDKDGHVDVVVGNNKQGGNTDKNYIYWNKGNLQFIESPSLGSSKVSSVAIGDFNNDEIMDVAIGNYDESSAIWLGNGDATFTEISQFGEGYLKGMIVADYNTDGILDVAAAKDKEGFEIYTAK